MVAPPRSRHIQGMRRLLPLLLACALAASARPALAQVPDSAYFRLQSVGDGVWAAVATTGRITSNMGVVDMGEGLLVVDASLSGDAAAALRHQAERLTGKRVRWLVNTHGHADHVRGNQAFADLAILGTPATHGAITELAAVDPDSAIAEARALQVVRERRAAAGETELIRDDARFLLEAGRENIAQWRTFSATPPTVIVVDDTVLEGTARSVELRFFAGGHTAGDLVVHVPDAGVVFMGDLLFVGWHPPLFFGDPALLLAAHRAVARLSPDVVVPGHGPVADTDALRATARYLEALDAHAARLLEEGIPPDQAVDAPMPDALRDLHHAANFYPGNLRAALERVARQDP